MRILVADDHSPVLLGMRGILNQLGNQVDIVEAMSYEGALEALAVSDLDFDMIVLDLRMPDMTQDEGIQAIKARAGEALLVVLSASENPDEVRSALQAGARGFIPKASNPDVMLNALRLILSGEVYIPPIAMRNFGPAMPSPLQHSRQSRKKDSESPLDELTPRQRDVLNRLAEGKSNRQIAEDLGLAEGTVKIHIAGILKTLRVSNRSQAIITLHDHHG